MLVNSVYLCDNVVLEGGRKYVIRAFCAGLVHGGEYLFDPYDENLAKRCVVCPSSVSTSSYSFVSCCIYNSSASSVTLYKGMCLGKVEPI